MLKSIKIKGLACEGCCKRLEDAITKIEGVRSAYVNFDEKRADVLCEAYVKIRKIKSVIRGSGFSVRGIRTQKKDYRALMLKGYF